MGIYFKKEGREKDFHKRKKLDFTNFNKGEVIMFDFIVFNLVIGRKTLSYVDF